MTRVACTMISGGMVEIFDRGDDLQLTAARAALDSGDAQLLSDRNWPGTAVRHVH